MTGNKKMTLKSLTGEFCKLKDDWNEVSVLKKKVYELENALKTCNDSKEIMKDQLKVLEQKVKPLQKIRDLSSSNNGDTDKTTSERFK